MSKRSQQRLNNALTFLLHYSEDMRRHAPAGKELEYAAVYWRPHAPIYCWSSTYGDFAHASILAGINNGLIEERRPGYYEYRITEAGRNHLAALSADAAMLADGNSRYSAYQIAEITERTKAPEQKDGL